MLKESGVTPFVSSCGAQEVGCPAGQSTPVRQRHVLGVPVASRHAPWAMMYGPVLLVTSGEQHGDAGGQSALDAQLGLHAVTPASVTQVSLVAQHAVPHWRATGHAVTHACVVESQTVPPAHVHVPPQPSSPHVVPPHVGVHVVQTPNALQVCPLGHGHVAEQPGTQPASTRCGPASVPKHVHVPNPLPSDTHD